MATYVAYITLAIVWVIERRGERVKAAPLRRWGGKGSSKSAGHNESEQTPENCKEYNNFSRVVMRG
jgi:hypothetical protein